MNRLEQRILKDATVANSQALDVSDFLTKQVDIELLDWCATQIAEHLAPTKPTRIVTIESGGIAICTLVALKLRIPLVICKKQVSTLDDSTDFISSSVYSFTKATTYQLTCKKSHILPSDRVLFIDDVLAQGNALQGIRDIINQSNAQLAGTAFLFEKSFQSGYQIVQSLASPTISLARLSSLEGGIHFLQETN
jgi:xanthine phosphoribosyltransferase